MELTTAVVEDNAEKILTEFYGAESASALVTDEQDNEFTLEVWHAGELRRDPRPFTYETEDGWHQVVGLGDSLGKNLVEMKYLMSPVEDALTPEPLIERFDLEPTDHERVFTKNSVTPSDVAQGERIARAYPSYIVLSKTNIMEKPTDWGYMRGYDLITVAFSDSLTPDRTREIINEIKAET